MIRELNPVMTELHGLTETLKPYGAVEAVMRVRALAELAEHLETHALLSMVAAYADAQVDDARREA